MSDARIVEVDDNGVATYRASAVYSCVNALVLARQGYDGAEAPPWLQVRYNAGHDHEPLILNKLEREYSFNLKGNQDEIELRCGGKAKIVGHIDAMHVGMEGFPIRLTHVNGDGNNQEPRPFETGDVLVVVDAKALAVSTFTSWERGRFTSFPYYAWQQRCYMLGLGATGLVMAVKNKNTDQLNVEYFTDTYMDDIVRRADIIKKVMEVEGLAALGGDGVFAKECTPMFPCPYFFMHPDDEGKKKGKQKNDLSDEVRIALVEKVGTRAGLKTAADNIQSQLDLLDDEIRDMVGGVEVSEKTPNGTLTTYHHGYTSPNWGAIAIACGLDGPEDAKNAFNTAKKSEKLSVKVSTPRGKK